MECTEIHLNKLVKPIISIFCYWIRTEYEKFILWCLIAILLVLDVHGIITLSISMTLSLLFTIVFRYFLPTLGPEPKSLNFTVSVHLKELQCINFKQSRNGKVDILSDMWHYSSGKKIFPSFHDFMDFMKSMISK